MCASRVTFRMAKVCVSSLFLCGIASAVPTFLELPADQTVVEGGDATFSCNATVNGVRQPLSYRIGNGAGATLQGVGANITALSLVNGVVGACVLGEFNTQMILKGVAREADGYTITCAILDGVIFTAPQNEPPAIISVIYPPVYSLLPNRPTTVLEGGDFTYSFVFDAKPSTTNFTWSRDGQVISSGARIATSVSTITITSTTRSDSGVYEVVSYNEAGRGAANFTLDVQFPPLIINRASQTVLAQGGVFSFNCTSESANPLAVDYAFQKDGRNVDGVRATVQGAVLTISSVQAGDGGNYSCSANNSVGRDTVYNNLIVPPSAPRAITVSGVGPFSATVSWQPPLEDGGAVGPLMYTVTLTNTLNGSDVTTFSPTPALVMELTDLRHSMPYRVQVVAGNEAGMGPAAEEMFRTNDTVPTVSGVVALALTLDTVLVDVTVSDDGGQPVLEYTVSQTWVNGGLYVTGVSAAVDGCTLLVPQVTVNGTTVVLSGATGNVTGVALMNGVTYSVSVVARNSIGDSETFTGSFRVPFPPNITMQPVAVTPNETTTRCCAGILVFLTDPSDTTIVFTAQVSTDGTPFTARNVTREGDVVYVQGLQAGTPYEIRLTGRNQFGSVAKEVLTTPLIGYPSNPSMPVVSVVGSSVSIQLSTRYPGTNARGQFRFSLIFSAASTAKRQSLPPTEVQVDPTGLDTSVTTTHTLTDVVAGSHGVSVMAVNENGMSQDTTATFVVKGPAGVDTVVVIGVVVAVAIVILVILILSAFLFVLVCMKYKNTIRCCKSGSSYDDVKVELKGVHSHFEDVKLEPNPAYGEVSPSKAPTEPQPYEDFVAIGGATSGGDATMEENPAYQSAEPQPYEESASKEDTAYQSVDTTVPQTGEPVYL